MATGFIALFPGGIAPDGSGSGNNTAALSYEVSAAVQTTNTPKATQLKLLFDGATDEHWLFSFLLPGNYASGGTLRGKVKFTSAITGTATRSKPTATTTPTSLIVIRICAPSFLINLFCMMSWRARFYLSSAV